MKHIPSRLWAMLLLMVSVMLPSAVLADGSHRLTVVAKPTMAGSFNTNSADLVAGETIHLYAYSNGNFDFVQWTDNTGAVVSEQMDFTYIMPNRDVTLTAEYNYNPANPANPASNYWDKEHGELIVDDFETGSLYSAVYNALGNSDDSEVSMLTVAGVINNNDFGIANYFSNCSVLDLSRVTGVTAVPSYAFDYASFETVKLPATIETIGYYAFGECSKLSSITLYAMTPPTLESEVFSGVPEGLVVYVPAGAIGQYQDSEAWSKFTLLPIQEDIRSITVSLPGGVKSSDYAKMWLELTNTKSGQRMHYIITDRSAYTFANIIKNTSWSVALKNERGDVFGKIDNVEVKDEDVSTSFVSLSKPLKVSLKVQTPDGKNVTEQTQITWTDASGNYIAQGTSLSSLPVGCQLNYSVALSQDLTMLYGTPKAVAYTLKDGTNSLTCKLKAIKQVKVTGKVKDATSGLALSGAVISASQTFGGKYSKTINGKTDVNGVYTFTVYDVPTTMAFAATDYISQSIVCDELIAGKATVDMNDVSLKPISGATINVGFTYTNVDGETQNWYSDYQNVSYTLYNKTRKKAINQFNVQYPQIVLLEEVSEGDVLELTAESKTQAFKPVKATATITASQTAEAQFSIVELGQLKAEYSQSGNVDVVASLYDASGKLMKTYNYRDMSLTVSNLADGNYTLVSMGGSQFFNSIYDLAQLPQSGLKAGTDYEQNAVTVKSGKVTTVNIDLVPKLDESKLYYTGDNTSFTVNKPSIVAGNYLTLTGRIDFKTAYATNVSNVNLIVDFPESYSFVENSVMVGNGSSNYILNGTRLSIPMAHYTDRVRFCAIPTLGGDYAPSAFVQFDLNGETVLQPIGSAPSEIKAIEIIVPSSTANEHFRVSGKAESHSSVSIYLDGILCSKVVADASGSWSSECQLIEPKNFSEHSIYAIVEKASRPTLISETKILVFNPLDVHVNNVEMTFWNAWAQKQYSVIWDFVSGTVNCNKYDFYTETEMTFLIDIAYHDRRLIPLVWLHVHTSDGKVRSLLANYDKIKDGWIAVDKFSSEALPTRVSVSIENMMFDPSADVSYELLMDEYVGDINLKETIEDADGSITYNYTDGNGDDIASVKTFESTLTKDQLIEELKKEGFEEEEFPDEDSDYVPEDEDEVFDKDIKVLLEPNSASMALIRSGEGNPCVVIIRLIREEDKRESSLEFVSSSISKRWHQYFSIRSNCQIISEYKTCTEYLDKYVKTITSTLVAHTIFVDYRKLPKGTKIPMKQVLGTINRKRYSYKRHTSCATEISTIPLVCRPLPPSPPTPPVPPVSPILDPSGYVYEGVSSNRIEGVTATAFYKEMVEDMYGDLHENIVKWDAEEYAQENPLFTDENGMYAWDVPQGLWQVKFEKEGYETTYSEWLPVPPPQLDINIPMKQNVQPVVKSARAFQDAVELEFDKYMMPEQLTTENITVMVGKKAVTGTIKLLDEEVSREGETETFASKVRFNAAKPFEGTEVTLMVSNRVKSYAGIRMQDDFSQRFTIEEEVHQIDCKELVKAAYGHGSTVSVAVLPASAAAGKTLRVKSSSAMILSTDAESLVLDKNGKAEIKVHGELPGTAALTFSVDGYDLTATTTVNVVTILLGDVNGDGEVNAADIVVLQNYLSDRQATVIDESAADADGDGSITDGDVLAIVAIILNKR